MTQPSSALAPLTPLIGQWTTQAETPMGPTRCRRAFARAVGGAYVELTAIWEFGSGGSYEERALFGPTKDGPLGIWSFTSDGGQAIGGAADVGDIHPTAVGFISAMPAGRARQAYWLAEDGSLEWVVEAETPAGWERLAAHRYQRIS